MEYSYLTSGILQSCQKAGSASLRGAIAQKIPDNDFPLPIHVTAKLTLWREPSSVRGKLLLGVKKPNT